MVLIPFNALITFRVQGSRASISKGLLSKKRQFVNRKGNILCL